MPPKIVSAAMAMATCALAAPLNARDASPSIFSNDLNGLFAGFNNPTVESSAGGHAVCLSGTVDVTASGTNALITGPAPANQSALTDFLVEGVQINSTIAKQYIGGANNVSGTFSIYSQLCFPNGVLNATTVQFLIPGIGSDRLYWDNAPNYSYVDYAAQQGQTTFIYDRLGTGLSDHPDPLQVVQAKFQVEIAHELIQLLRAGSLSNHAFKHVVGVGHSFGSFQTLGLATNHPADLDAAVLTGFSSSTAGMPVAFAAADLTIASQAAPARFADLSNGYMSAANVQGLQYAFFRAAGSDPALLNLLETTKQTVSIGEYLTISSLFTVASNFTGPVDVVIAEHDLPSCDGNCYLPHNLAAAVKGELFPAASNASSWFIAPGAGHFLNYHYAAPAAYEHIQNFIRQNGF
jgi:pimeloyl-ACP methyl ester carboxylesterase